MQQNNYIQKLKYCVNPDEVWELMKGRIYPGSNGSKFEDKKIYLPNANKGWNALSSPNDNILGLAMRVLVFLKLDDQNGDMPLNSGKYAYANKFFRLFYEEQLVDGRLDSPGMVDSNILDELIEIGVKNNVQAKSTKNKIRKLEDWISAADKLPYFLQVDPFIFVESAKYEEFLELHRKELSANKKIGGPKQPYSLSALKVISSEAISYIENYGNEILTCAKIFKENFDKSHEVRKRILVKFLRSESYQFNEPSIRKKQHYCRTLKNNTYIAEKSCNMTPIQIFINAITKLEAACVIIVLMLTAMRKQELALLERYPKITNIEYYNLKRLVYKTSNSERGDSVEMPIPPIVKNALEFLSQISEIKDGKKIGPLNLMDINFSIKTTNSESRIGYIIHSFCLDLGIKNPPSAHMFRHAMAFIIMHYNEKDGLELARRFLNHKSIEMTLIYMGHSNVVIRKAMSELGQEEGEMLVDIISEEINSGKRLSGPAAKRLFKSVFIGRYARDINSLLIKSMRLLVESGRIRIIQTPTNFCVHDTSNPNAMACQRGLDIVNIASVPIIPARCEGASCECALFTEQHVEELKEQAKIFISDYPEELRERLSKNTYFVNDCGIDSLSNPFRKLIDEYDENKIKEA